MAWYDEDPNEPIYSTKDKILIAILIGFYIAAFLALMVYINGLA